MIDAEGLFGQVVEVAQFSSRVMLVIDAAHAVPGAGQPQRLPQHRRRHRTHRPSRTRIRTGHRRHPCRRSAGQFRSRWTLSARLSGRRGDRRRGRTDDDLRTSHCKTVRGARPQPARVVGVRRQNRTAQRRRTLHLRILRPRNRSESDARRLGHPADDRDRDAAGRGSPPGRYASSGWVGCGRRGWCSSSSTG